jgi:hypothetical protein
MKPASAKARTASPTSGIISTRPSSKRGSFSSALRLCGANFFPGDLEWRSRSRRRSVARVLGEARAPHSDSTSSSS